MTDTKKNSALADPVPAKMTDAEIAEIAERFEAVNPTDPFWIEFARAIESRALSSAAGQEPVADRVAMLEGLLAAVVEAEFGYGQWPSEEVMRDALAATPQSANDQRRKVIKGLCHQQSYDDDGRKCIVAREAVEGAIALLSAAPAQPQEQPVAAQPTVPEGGDK